MWACNREERLNNTGVYKHLTKITDLFILVNIVTNNWGTFPERKTHHIFWTDFPSS